MIPDDVGEWVGKPHHVDIVVHDAIPQLKNLQQVSRPARGEVEETLQSRTDKIAAVTHGDISSSNLGGREGFLLTWDPNLCAV